MTGMRINAPTVHAQTLASQKSPEMVLCTRNDRVFIGTGALNSNTF